MKEFTETKKHVTIFLWIKNFMILISRFYLSTVDSTKTRSSSIRTYIRRWKSYIAYTA